MITISKRLAIFSIVTILVISSTFSLWWITQKHDNTFNKPIHLQSNKEVQDFIDEMNWPGDGSPDDPYVFEGLNLNEMTNIQLQIQNTDKHIHIRNNRLSNGLLQGIMLNNVEHIQIYNNTLYDIRGDAIFVNNSRFVKISQNHIYGIEDAGTTENGDIVNFSVSIDIAFSSDIQVISNEVHDSFDGIWFWVGVTNSLLSSNLIYNMELHGIGIGGSGTTNITSSSNEISNVTYGYWITGDEGSSLISDNNITNSQEGMRIFSSFLTIQQNRFSNNQRGLYFRILGFAPRFGHNHTIFSNVFENSADEAIFLTGDNSTIHNNDFIDNNGNLPQIVDNGNFNHIYGNYYNDWTSPDVDDDNIVDVAYPLEGDSMNVDPYPYVKAVNG